MATGARGALASPLVPLSPLEMDAPDQTLSLRLFTGVSTEELLGAVHRYLTSPLVFQTMGNRALGLMKSRGLLNVDELNKQNYLNSVATLTYLLYHYMSRSMGLGGFAMPRDERQRILEHLFDQEFAMPYLDGPGAFFDRDSRIVQRWFAWQQKIRASSALTAGENHSTRSPVLAELLGPALSGQARMHLTRPYNDQGAAVAGRVKIERGRGQWPQGEFQVLSLDAYPWPVILYKDRMGFFLPNTRNGIASELVLSAPFPNAATLDDAFFHRASYFVDEELNFHLTGRFGNSVGEIVVPTAGLLQRCRERFHAGTRAPPAPHMATPVFWHRTRLTGADPELMRLCTVLCGQNATAQLAANTRQSCVFTRSHAALRVDGNYMVYAIGDLIAPAPRVLFTTMPEALDPNDKTNWRILCSARELRGAIPLIKDLLLRKGCVDAEILHAPLLPNAGSAVASVLRLCFTGTMEEARAYAMPMAIPMGGDGQFQVDAFFLLLAPDDRRQPIALHLFLVDCQLETLRSTSLRLLTGRVDAFTIALLDKGYRGHHRFLDVQWARLFTDNPSTRPGIGTTVILAPSNFKGMPDLMLADVLSYSHVAGILSVTCAYDEVTPNQMGASRGVLFYAMAFDDVEKRYTDASRSYYIDMFSSYYGDAAQAKTALVNGSCFHRRWFVGGFRSADGHFDVHLAGFGNEYEDEVPSEEIPEATDPAFSPDDLEEMDLEDQ